MICSDGTVMALQDAATPLHSLRELMPKFWNAPPCAQFGRRIIKMDRFKQHF